MKTRSVIHLIMCFYTFFSHNQFASAVSDDGGNPHPSQYQFEALEWDNYRIPFSHVYDLPLFLTHFSHDVAMFVRVIEDVTLNHGSIIRMHNPSSPNPSELKVLSFSRARSAREYKNILARLSHFLQVMIDSLEVFAKIDQTSGLLFRYVFPQNSGFQFIPLAQDKKIAQVMRNLQSLPEAFQAVEEEVANIASAQGQPNLRDNSPLSLTAKLAQKLRRLDLLAKKFQRHSAELIPFVPGERLSKELDLGSQIPSADGLIKNSDLAQLLRRGVHQVRAVHQLRSDILASVQNYQDSSGDSVSTVVALRPREQSSSLDSLNSVLKENKANVKSAYDKTRNILEVVLAIKWYCLQMLNKDEQIIPISKKRQGEIRELLDVAEGISALLGLEIQTLYFYLTDTQAGLSFQRTLNHEDRRFLVLGESTEIANSFPQLSSWEGTLQGFLQTNPCHQVLQFKRQVSGRD